MAEDNPKAEVVSHVFISYAREDGLEKAIEIRNWLATNALNPWRDKDDISGGAGWSVIIDEAIADSYAMVVIVTPKAMESINVTYEWASAIGRGDVKIVLIDYGETNIPDQLKSRHWLDYKDSDFWAKLTTDLQHYQAEDGLVNVRIPVEADIELKALARQAFVHYDGGAIDYLADMYDEPLAREILISGLNKRQYAIRDIILRQMITYGFDDERAIPKLMEILLVERSPNKIQEDKRDSLRCLTVKVIENIGMAGVEVGVDKIVEELAYGDDIEQFEMILSTLRRSARPTFALRYYKAALSRREREFKLYAIQIFDIYLDGVALGVGDKIDEFDDDFVPLLRDILAEISPNFNVDENFELALHVKGILTKAKTPMANALLSEYKGMI